VQPGSIRTAQSALKQLGFDPGPVDDFYGKLTRDAVLQFQAAHSLPRTGVLDAGTWSAIVGQLSN
jgi:peptidoglycan hydrolase-like protein with peptidoglycan-binding domain